MKPTYIQEHWISWNFPLVFIMVDEKQDEQNADKKMISGVWEKKKVLCGKS